MGSVEMSDSVCESETASCAAITEKRQGHRSGGCTGILFRLFDWNRRFAKKKLFSRKLLPAAHQAKQAAKKFKGDEKMPIAKLHLIADENKSGFSKPKKNVKGTDIVRKQEMRAPCLVARLMGLDLIPAVQRDRTRKPSLAGPRNAQRHEFVAVGSEGDGDARGSHLEKGNLKPEIRPQELQKTGLSERHATTLLAPPGMQLKGALSRNRKHHHTKLATPVKSPWASSARTVTRVSRSRLIDAATKILEPGLVARDKCKFAISNPSGMTGIPADDVMLPGSQICTLHRANQSDHHTALAKHLAAHAACRNCGCPVENASFRPIVAARISDCATSSSSDLVFAPHQSETTQPQPYLSPGEQGSVTNQKKAVSLASRLKNDLLEHSRLPRDEFPVSRNFQKHTGQTQSSQKDESPSISSKHGSVTHSCPSSREERVPERAKVGNFRKRRITSATDSVNGAEGFLGFNRKSSGKIHEMVSAVPETSDTYPDVAKISCPRQSNSSSQLTNPVHKRSFIHAERLVEKPCFVSSKSSVQRNPKYRPLTGKDFLIHYYNDAPIKRSCNRAKWTTTSSKSVNRAISSASNSSVTQMGEVSISSNAGRTFSNCSCITGNLDDFSGLMVHSDFQNKTYDHPQTFGIGNLKQGIHRDVVIDLYARTSKNFCYSDVARSSSDEFRPWKKVPLSMDLDTLIQDVDVVVRSRTDLSSMSIDEMIEWEMSHSFEKWTDFRNESLENGILIDSYIFQRLVEEIIEDLHGACGLKHSY